MRIQLWSTALLILLVASIVGLQVWLSLKPRKQSIPPRYVVNVTEGDMTTRPALDFVDMFDVWTRMDNILIKAPSNLTFTHYQRLTNLAHIMSFDNLHPDRPDDLVVHYNKQYDVYLAEGANVTVRGTNKTTECVDHIQNSVCQSESRINEFLTCEGPPIGADNKTHFITLHWSVPNAAVFQEMVESFAWDCNGLMSTEVSARCNTIIDECHLL